MSSDRRVRSGIRRGLYQRFGSLWECILVARSVSIEMKSSIWTHRFGVDGPYERIHLVEYPDRFFSEWFADLCDWRCEHRSVFDGLLESDVAFVVEQGREDLFAELVGECKE